MTPETRNEFSRKLMNIRDTVNGSISPHQELNHLQKVLWTNRAFFILGYGISWTGINPISMIFLGIYLSLSWTIVMHHINHGAYNGKEYPKRYHSKNFAKGWRRYINWIDWMYPPAWDREHNILHHMYVNETKDPDQLSYWEGQQTPNQRHPWINYSILLLKGLTWRIIYYPISTYKWYWKSDTCKEPNKTKARFWCCVIRDCYLPHILFHYGLLALPFLVFSQEAAAYYLINRLGAEFVTALHTYFIIGPNHLGEDLSLMKSHYKNKGEFFLAQILSSCNFKTGGFWNDYFHGYLNYQIEHHLFPNLTPLKYVKMQPKVKALCREYGIPYIQESIFKRSKKFLDVFAKHSKMQTYSFDSGGPIVNPIADLSGPAFPDKSPSCPQTN